MNLTEFIKNLYSKYVLVEAERNSNIPEIENVEILKDNPLTELIGNLFGNWIAGKIDNFLMIINSNMPEITTLFIVFCAICMMLTNNSGKWFNRALFGFFIGAILIIV